MRYYLDGNDPDTHERYMCWKIVDEDGVIICKFFGPMALSCAATACKAMNNGTNILPGSVEAANMMMTTHTRFYR